jgi:hypothetical protein
MIVLYEEVIEANRQDGSDDPRLNLQAAALYLEALASTQAEALASQHAVHTLMRRLHRSSRWLPGMRGLVRLSTADQLAQAAGWKFRW